jgi:hypothetical protein
VKIGIVGTGCVGRALGVLFAREGHDLFFGASDRRAGAEAAARAGRGARAGGIGGAVRFGAVLWYTLGPGFSPGGGTGAGAKVVVECRGRFAARVAPPSADGGGAGLVRAYYDVPAEAFELSEGVPFCEYGPAMFLCGDDPAAKAAVASLAEQIGFGPVDCGPLRNAPVVGALGEAIRLLARRDGRGLAERAAALRVAA